MTALYKFLEAGGRCGLTGEVWPLPADGPGEWVDLGGRCDPSRLGFVLQRPADLAGWASAELYRAEASGAVRVQADAVIVERARLIARCVNWVDLSTELGGLAHDRAQALIAAHSSVAEYAADLAAMREWKMHVPMLFVSALIHSLVADPDRTNAAVRREAFLSERARQSAWLAERL
jgi:hypothetical protein